MCLIPDFVPQSSASKTDLATADFVVTVGTAAADMAFSSKPKVPIISVLITENAFSVLAEKHYGSIEDCICSTGILYLS